jgi:hypothetical protein
MDKVFHLNTKIALVLYMVLDLLCTGMGMGVPFFCILLGFFIGWYIVRKVSVSTPDVRVVFRKVFLYAVVTSAFTLVIMCLIWGPLIPSVFDPNYDFENTGIPMILYGPKISFIGWLFLMIFISPFLQLLTTLFGSHLTLLWLTKETR